MLATYQNGSDTAYAYAYDDNGNITSITRGSTSVTYQYNGANELIRENNGFTNQTVTYTYDTWGNITEKKIYAYTTATNPGTPTSTIPYVYGNGREYVYPRDSHTPSCISLFPPLFLFSLKRKSGK